MQHHEDVGRNPTLVTLEQPFAPEQGLAHGGERHDGDRGIIDTDLEIRPGAGSAPTRPIERRASGQSAALARIPPLRSNGRRSIRSGTGDARHRRRRNTTTPSVARAIAQPARNSFHWPLNRMPSGGIIRRSRTARIVNVWSGRLHPATHRPNVDVGISGSSATTLPV